MSNLRVDELESLTTGRSVPVDSIDTDVRQDLANPNKGAAMVARGVVAVGSIADLVSLPAGQRQEDLQYLVASYYAGEGRGGGTFYWTSANRSADVATDPLMGIFVAPSDAPDGVSGVWVREHSSFVHVDHVGVLKTSEDQADKFHAALLLASRHGKNLLIGRGTYYLSELRIPSTTSGIIGESDAKDGVRLRHMAGATGDFIRLDDGVSRVTNTTFKGLYLIGNGEPDEGFGFNLEGISYSKFESVRAREFTAGGMSGDGSSGRQVTNNIFLDLTLNNNGGDGLSTFNTFYANTFSSAEFSGNTGAGVRLNGQANIFAGATAQGNKDGDFVVTSGYANEFQGYCEGRGYPVRFGAGAWGNKASIRSAYPLWQSYKDASNRNEVSTGAGQEKEAHLFTNPFFSRFYGLLPEGVWAMNNNSKMTPVADPESLSGYSVEVDLGFGVGYIGFGFDLPDKDMSGQWITAIFRLDVSGISVLPGNMRVHTKTGESNGLSQGQYVANTGTVMPYYFNDNPADDVVLCADIRFPPGVEGPHSVIFYPSYGGGKGEGKLKIKSIHIVKGRRSDCSLSGDVSIHPCPVVTSELLSNTSAGINLKDKTPGRRVWNETLGVVMEAQGSEPSDPWKAYGEEEPEE